MTAAKHTPGPWFARIRGPVAAGIFHEDANGPLIASVPENYITSDNQEVLDAEGQANARLIAAAPDLLAACEGALRLLAKCDVQIDARYGVPEVRALMASIAKAKGGAQ